MATTERVTGTIIKVFPQRGFGFVLGVDGTSLFFHAKDVKPRIAFDRMHEGIGVSYCAVDLSKDGATDTKGNGMRAIEVEVIA